MGDKAKVGLYLSIELKKQLERLGEVRDRTLSNLCEVILKREVKAAIASGELPSEEEAIEQTQAEGAIRSVLRKIAQGEPPSPGEIAIAADELDVDSKQLMHRVEKSREGNGATNRS